MGPLQELVTTMVTNIQKVASSLEMLEKGLPQIIRDIVDERMRELEIHASVGNNDHLISKVPTLSLTFPSPQHNLQQRLVNSPHIAKARVSSPDAAKTPVKDSVEKHSQVQELGKENATGLRAKLNSKDKVAKANEVKKDLSQDFAKIGATAEVDFLTVSLAKGPERVMRGRRNQKGAKKKEEDVLTKKEVVDQKTGDAELKKKELAAKRKEAVAKKKEEAAKKKKKEAELNKEKAAQLKEEKEAAEKKKKEAELNKQKAAQLKRRRRRLRKGRKRLS